ncbi:MAG: CoA-transferase, partial [Actinomycetes bacterium]
VGGAMDLASGAAKMFVMMTLFDKSGKSKLVTECTAPLTAVKCVNRIYSDMAIIDITAGGIDVLEVFGISEGELLDRIGIH